MISLEIGSCRCFRRGSIPRKALFVTIIALTKSVVMTESSVVMSKHSPQKWNSTTKQEVELWTDQTPRERNLSRSVSSGCQKGQAQALSLALRHMLASEEGLNNMSTDGCPKNEGNRFQKQRYPVLSRSHQYFRH